MASFRFGALRDLFGRSEEPPRKDPGRNIEEQVEKPVVRAVRKPVEADSYTAADIEVLEGLEPVRRRPGMYVGGTDEKALHHLFAEVIDNSMDEAVAGHATWIEVKVEEGGFLSVTDNGRGIPVDPHPKFKSKSALEVIMTTLHSGGKFDSKVYNTSGGLHGVGVSVVNALSETLEVEVARGPEVRVELDWVVMRRRLPPFPPRRSWMKLSESAFAQETLRRWWRCRCCCRIRRLRHWSGFARSAWKSGVSRIMK